MKILVFEIFEKGQISRPFSGLAPSKLKICYKNFNGSICAYRVFYLPIFRRIERGGEGWKKAWSCTERVKIEGLGNIIKPYYIIFYENVFSSIFFNHILYIFTLYITYPVRLLMQIYRKLKLSSVYIFERKHTWNLHHKIICSQGSFIKLKKNLDLSQGNGSDSALVMTMIVI